MQIGMIEVECHISIKKGGNCFLNSIKTELLQEIKNNGSLRGASKKLNISYQHAWTMIDEMNRVAPEPMVIKQRGGANGGGAEISEYGKKILNDYHLIEAQVQKMISQINVEINL
jgi:molybdate transport system regulatory protein